MMVICFINAVSRFEFHKQQSSMKTVRPLIRSSHTKRLYAMVRPTADAMILSSCINFSNCAGKSDCAPSDSAFSGS